MAKLTSVQCLSRASECMDLADEEPDPGRRERLTKIAENWLELAREASERWRASSPDEPYQHRLSTKSKH